MSLIVNWLRSLSAFVLLAFYIAIVGPPALAFAFFTGGVGHIFALGRFGASAVRRLLGIRLEVSGLEHVVADRPTLYCINHRSNVDVVARFRNWRATASNTASPRCKSLAGSAAATTTVIPTTSLTRG